MIHKLNKGYFKISTYLRNHTVLTRDKTETSAFRLPESIRHFWKGGRVLSGVFQRNVWQSIKNTQRAIQNYFQEDLMDAPKHIHTLCVDYRDNYNMLISNRILYNHKSPRKGMDYLTRKIRDGSTQVHLGPAKNIRFWNLDAISDWGLNSDLKI